MSKRRSDGRHVLEPLVFSFSGRKFRCDESQIRLLHNEDNSGTAGYPLSIMKKEFFSEALGDKNAHAKDYLNLVLQSMKIIAQNISGGALPFPALEKIGRGIQKLDAQFARTRINKSLDDLHSCLGPNPDHPYSKITVCRTTVPVDIGNRIVPFFFEKFLVSYSYLDADGRRRSTVTPIHSHPINFETVYFTSYGKDSCAVEQEFHLVVADEKRVIQENGRLNADFIGDLRLSKKPDISVVPGKKTKIMATDEPIQLDHFYADQVLKAYPDIIVMTDGLFRLHKVEVIDDLQKETRYFALDNYFGPTGRVLLYSDDGQINVWSHDEWD